MTLNKNTKLLSNEVWNNVSFLHKYVYHSSLQAVIIVLMDLLCINFKYSMNVI